MKASNEQLKRQLESEFRQLPNSVFADPPIEEKILSTLRGLLDGDDACPDRWETLRNWMSRRPWSCPFRQIVDQRLGSTKESIVKFSVSDNRHDYQISNDDYKRGLTKEREYLLRHKATLFRIFDNRCANCGDNENGLEVDHFIFSKNEGGCFELRHKQGYSVNNAIPLCEKCNRSKSDQSYKDFFSADRLKVILEKNSQMTERLNPKKKVS